MHADTVIFTLRGLPTQELDLVHVLLKVLQTICNAVTSLPV
jgi:hypothetical protein